MKALNRIGGAFFALVLGIAVITGFQSDIGRPIWDSLWNATTTVLRYFRDLVGDVDPLEGRGLAAIGWVAAGTLVLLFFLKKPITVQQFFLLLLTGAVVALILWNPAVLS
jgi:hypothetical protein